MLTPGGEQRLLRLVNLFITLADDSWWTFIESIIKNHGLIDFQMGGIAMSVSELKALHVGEGCIWSRKIEEKTTVSGK